MCAHDGDEIGAHEVLYEGKGVHQLVLLSDVSADRKDDAAVDFQTHTPSGNRQSEGNELYNSVCFSFNFVRTK